MEYVDRMDTMFYRYTTLMSKSNCQSANYFISINFAHWLWSFYNVLVLISWSFSAFIHLAFQHLLVS